VFPNAHSPSEWEISPETMQSLLDPEYIILPPGAALWFSVPINEGMGGLSDWRKKLSPEIGSHYQKTLSNGMNYIMGELSYNGQRCGFASGSKSINLDKFCIEIKMRDDIYSVDGKYTKKKKPENNNRYFGTNGRKSN
jgi:hypothetical protein